MKNTKKLIISFCISLALVLFIRFLFNSFFSSNEETIYMLTKDVYKGENITEEDVKSITVINQKHLKNSINVNYVDKVAKENLQVGKILENTDMINKEEIKEGEKQYEYVSIEIKDISDSVAYQLNKGDNINVYFTSKDISSGENLKTFIKDNKTLKILDNKKIIGLYDSSGREIIKGNTYNAIMLRVTSEEAMILSNIKEEGYFNISLVK